MINDPVVVTILLSSIFISATIIRRIDGDNRVNTDFNRSRPLTHVLLLLLFKCTFLAYPCNGLQNMDESEDFN